MTSSTKIVLSQADSISIGSSFERNLIEKTKEYLDLYAYDNAIFFAERLVSHKDSEENIHLLATCYYRSGKKNRAISILENVQSAENRYLLAISCFEQNKLVEAENALLYNGQRNSFDFTVAKENIPNGAAGLYLMGKICRRANRRQQAVEYLVKSLELDPYMWAAYEELCDLGANFQASRFFGKATYFNQVIHQEQDLDNNVDPEIDKFMEEGVPTDSSRLNDDIYVTPDHRTNSGNLANPAPTRWNAKTTAEGASTYKTPVNLSGNNGSIEVLKKPRVCGIPSSGAKIRKTSRRPLTESDDKVRLNTRLYLSSAQDEERTALSNDVQESTYVAHVSVPYTPIPFRLCQQTPHTKEPQTKEERSDDGINTSTLLGSQKKQARAKGAEELLRLLSSFGLIYHHLSLYMCQEAIELIDKLPMNQQQSGWVQHQVGRLHFEMADYNQAYEIFRGMHRREPHRMAGLDIFSTTLWHLKKEVDLSYLAQQATEFDKLSSEAWCVAGNCFSLQKEHDTALAFFQRAIQLNPSYTYAFTLSGHEYVANEDFEKAISCYRHAIRTDPRHYNAWYGLGTIYYRQEKFEFAEYHFRRALEINPRSSLLHCFLGMVLHSTRKYDEALHVLDIAGELQPLNPQARFQKANVLITQHRYEEALEELKIVRNFAPRESSVHFMMGKVSKKLGRLDEAMQFFTTALYFHPKDNNIIKSAIDKINEADLDEDDRL